MSVLHKISDRAQENLKVYKIHSSWRHLRSKSTSAEIFLGSSFANAACLLTQSPTESLCMNFYSRTPITSTYLANFLHETKDLEFEVRWRTHNPFPRLRWVDIILVAIYSRLKCAVMVRPKSNGWQSRKVLFVGKSQIWSESSERVLYWLLRCLRLVQIYDLKIFSQKCNVTPAWYVICTIHEICANCKLARFMWSISSWIWALAGYKHSDWLQMDLLEPQHCIISKNTIIWF